MCAAFSRTYRVCLMQMKSPSATVCLSNVLLRDFGQQWSCMTQRTEMPRFGVVNWISSSKSFALFMSFDKNRKNRNRVKEDPLFLLRSPLLSKASKQVACSQLAVAMVTLHSSSLEKRSEKTNVRKKRKMKTKPEGGDKYRERMGKERRMKGRMGEEEDGGREGGRDASWKKNEWRIMRKHFVKARSILPLPLSFQQISWMAKVLPTGMTWVPNRLRDRQVHRF